MGVVNGPKTRNEMILLSSNYLCEQRVHVPRNNPLLPANSHTFSTVAKFENGL